MREIFLTHKHVDHFTGILWLVRMICQYMNRREFGFSMDIGGGKLTCCGDEPCNDSGKVYAENAAWLLHEAFCLHSQADIFDPYGKNHSTVKDACELAQKLHVKNLLFYHTEDKNLPARKDLYRAEGQKYFSGRIHVPDDLETLAL